MKKIILFVLLALLVSCSDDDDNPVQNYPEKRLVIISDFDKGSAFAITLMGAVETHFPNTKVEFITTPSYDVFEGSFLLEKAADDYPTGTCFLTVVGTGVDNQVVAFETGGNKFICPDNGLASRIIRNKDVDLYYLENVDLIGGSWDDIPYYDFYKNATLSLLADNDVSSFGSKADSPVTLNIQDAHKDGEYIVGQVLFKDNFGNCASNISPDLMDDFFDIGDIVKAEYNGQTFFLKYGTYYNSVRENENVCFTNSGNTIEFSVNFGNFGNRYNISAGGILKLSKSNMRIAVLMYNNSSVANDIYNGMLTNLHELGFTSGVNLDVITGSVDGNSAGFNDLINSMLSENPDLFIAISTPASQAAASIVPEDIPLIFTYVTDPESAGILDIRKNISGVSDKTNFIEYLNFVANLMPEMENAGNIYSSQESNSTFAKSQLEFYRPYYGFNIFYEDATSTEQISTAYENLKANNIEALLIAANNTASDAIPQLKDLCIADKIPLIGDSFEHAKNGALASISVDYTKLAAGTSDMIAITLLGKQLDSQPVMYFHTDLIALNMTTANAIGYSFPQDILDKAKYIYE